MDKSKFNDVKEIKKFTVGLSIIFFGIASIQFYLDNDLYKYFSASSLILILIRLIFPVIMKPVYIIFLYIGFGVGWVMTRIILSILFYFIFTPIGFIARLTGKKFLDMRFNSTERSYWRDVNLENMREESYEEQF